MKHLICLINLLTLLTLGCVSGCTSSFPAVLLPDGADGTPYQAGSPRQIESTNDFWGKTKQFFAPDFSSDETNLAARRHANAKPVGKTDRSSETANNTTRHQQPVLLDPAAFSAYAGTSAPGSLPGGSLFGQFGYGMNFQPNPPETFSAPVLSDTPDIPTETVAAVSVDKPNAATSVTKDEKTGDSQHLSAQAPKNMESLQTDTPRTILQAQDGDSRAFRQLLREIKETPPEDWKVDELELVQKMTNFRSTVRTEKNSELETFYLRQLRNSILPGKELQRESQRESLARRPPNPLRQGERHDETDDLAADLADDRDADFDAGFDITEEFPRKPLNLLPPKHTAAKHNAARLPESDAFPGRSSLRDATNRSDSPKYGHLAQIRDPSIMPVVHQSSHPGALPHSHAPGSVVPANYQYPMPPTGDPNFYSSANWNVQARIAADMLKREIEQTPSGRTFENEIRLRLLELALGNRSEAVRPFTTEDRQFTEAWSSMMLGFSTLYDDATIPDRKARIAGAAFRFDEGSLGMNRFCPIRLRNVQLVKDWQGFGAFIPKEDVCVNGEEVGLYLELENPTIRKSAHGYNVSASITYEIRDMAANVVEKSDKIPVEDTAPSLKRDHCIHLKVFLPKSLAQGQYQLRVNVTDMNSDSLQYAEEQLTIRVRTAPTELPR